MRTIDRGLPLGQYSLLFIGTKNIFRPKCQLPTSLNTTRRRENIVKAVSFIQFWPFYRRVLVMAVKDHRACVQEFSAVLTHATDNQNAFHSGPAASKGVYQIGIAVLVPKRAGIDPTLRSLN